MAEKDDKYNKSIKGQARNKRYEAAHPERKARWAPVMLYRREKVKNGSTVLMHTKFVRVCFT